MNAPSLSICRPRLRLVALVLLAASVLGCTAETSFELEQLTGAILTDSSYLILPNRAWRLQSDTGPWFFANSASMIFYVRETPSEPIIFGFIPEAGKPAPELTATWNGDDVTASIRTLASGELQIEMAPASIPPGTHFLTLHRSAAASGVAAGDGGEDGVTTFAHIGYRLAEGGYELEPDQFLRYRYLADLVVSAVTGSYVREKLGGFVFDGPRRARVRLPSAGGGLFVSKVQNTSSIRATFEISAGANKTVVELEPHERQVLRCQVPAGRDHLRLSAQGEANGFFLWGAPRFLAADAPHRPPIVLLTLDTTRRDALGAYAGATAHTPHLDAFAATATVFERAFTTAPWTLPAHASMFTGLYPSKHGAGMFGDHLEGRFETVAELLSRAGYLTAGFAGGTLSSFRFGVGQGFAVYRDADDGFETRGDALTTHVTSFLSEFGYTDRAEGPPLFLFANYFDPHFPFAAPADIEEHFDLSAKLASFRGDEAWKNAVEGSGEAWAQLVDGLVADEAAGRQLLRAAYDAEVTFMDRQIGQLFAVLEDSGLYDEALILAVADHGELLGEKGFFSHSARLDEELTHVPLIVKWPRQRQPHRIDALVSVVDIFATILAAAGLDIPRQDGIDLHPRSGALQAARERVLMEEKDSGFHRLFPHMKIADRLLGLQELERRWILWEDGHLCFSPRGWAWQSATCPPASDVEAAELWQELLSQAHRPEVDRIGLTNEERKNLRALGYLR